MNLWAQGLETVAFPHSPHTNITTVHDRVDAAATTMCAKLFDFADQSQRCPPKLFLKSMKSANPAGAHGISPALP